MSALFMMTVSNLQSRFHEELEAIDAYVNLLQDRAFVSAQGVIRLMRTLEDFKITDEKIHIKLIPGSYTLSELQMIHDFLQSIRPKLDDAFREAENNLLSTGEPAQLASTDAGSFEGECIQFVLDSLENDEEEERLKAIEMELREQIRSSDQDLLNDHSEDRKYLDEDHLVDFVIRSAIFIKASEKANRLAAAIETADEIDANLRIIRKDATVNVFRQGFILLMTIFDATIFDLMRLALRRDFFALIGIIAKQDRLSFDRFAGHSSFSTFRDEIIEEKLKSKYLKDILAIINNKGIPLEAPPYTYGHVVELVLRRNVHVHNRGFVDERYLERNDKGEIVFNFEHLTVGDFADIDKSYWEKAKTICRNCVRKTCDWVDTLTKSE